MRSVTFTTTGIYNKGDIKINRPFKTMPEIIEEFSEDGKRFYRTSTGGTYDADMYDQNFKVNKGKIKRKGHKGRSPALDASGLPINKSIKRYSNAKNAK